MPTWTEGSITKHWPDDTDECFHIENTMDFADIWTKARGKWPGIKMEELRITAEHIHTDCLTYDQHDPSDWTNFLLIEADTAYFDRITAPAES